MTTQELVEFTRYVLDLEQVAEDAQKLVDDFNPDRLYRLRLDLRNLELANA
jgi:hypothetical protein